MTNLNSIPRTHTVQVRREWSQVVLWSLHVCAMKGMSHIDNTHNKQISRYHFKRFKGEEADQKENGMCAKFWLVEQRTAEKLGGKNGKLAASRPYKTQSTFCLFLVSIFVWDRFLLCSPGCTWTQPRLASNLQWSLCPNLLSAVWFQVWATAPCIPRYFFFCYYDMVYDFSNKHLSGIYIPTTANSRKQDFIILSLFYHCRWQSALLSSARVAWRTYLSPVTWQQWFIN